MAHIHQKNTEGISYTYVVIETDDINNHPCLIEHPELFEIVDGDPPEIAHKLNYSSNSDNV
jgi:hypothetical protein